MNPLKTSFRENSIETSNKSILINPPLTIPHTWKKENKWKNGKIKMLISFKIISHSITQAKLLNKWKADIQRDLEHISFRKTSLVSTWLYHISSKRCGFEELMADYDHGATLFEWVHTLSLRENTDKGNDSRLNSALLWNV